jgi:hypothetical protein
VDLSLLSQGRAHTLDVVKVMLLQERRVRKRADGDSMGCQLITHVRCSKAIADAGVLGVSAAVLLLDGFDPLWYRGISESRVFPFPCLIVKGRIGVVMSALAVLPDWVLSSMSACYLV